MNPAGQPALAESRRSRDAAVRRTILASFGARVLTSLCSLAQVPVALALLGSERYGVWIALTSTCLLLNAGDLGLGVGMQNEAASAIGRGESQRVPALFWTTFVSLVALACLLFASGFPIAWFGNWLSLLNVSAAAEAHTLRVAAVTALALFCLGLPLTAAIRLANAYQWGWLAAAWNSVGAIGQLAAIVISRVLNFSFPAFVLVAGLPLLLANLGLLVHTTIRLRWRVSQLTWAPRSDRRALFRTGWHFCLPQLGATFIFNALPPAISAVAGPGAVTSYNVLQKLFGLPGQLQQIALAPTWPAYTDAAARNDAEWIRKTYRRSTFGSFLGMGLPLLGLALAAPVLVRLWTGAQVALEPEMIWLVAGWNMLLAVAHPPSFLLGGLGRVRRVAYFSFAGHVVSAVCMLAFGQRWGVSGVLAGLMSGFMLIGLPASFFEASAALKSLHHVQPFRD